MFYISNIIFKHPVVVIYHLFHTYFRLKCNLLYSHFSTSLHRSAVYYLHQVCSFLLKYLRCISKFHSPPTSAEVNKIWIYTSTPIHLHGVVLN
jgi:hypothetical protein